MMFKKATNYQKKIKLALSGPSGSGKTMTSLKIATNLELPVALIDTERGSAKVYGDLFNFDICELDSFSINKYIEAIDYAANSGYKTIIIDSLSHAYYWELAQVDKEKNSFQGWGKVRPLERQLLDTMLKVDVHVIATMRSKTEWVVEKDRNGKNVPKKVGTGPVQAKDIEYEFDIFGELTSDNTLLITKSRCPQLFNASFVSPGVEVANILKQWTGEGVEPPKFVKPDQGNNAFKSPTLDIVPNINNRQQIKERKVTQSQLNRLYTTANKSGLTNEEAKAIIQNFGFESSKDITMAKYDEVIKAIEEAKLANPWESWETENDAIAYAINQLPGMHMSQITQEWNNLEPEEMKTKMGATRYTKSRVWVQRIKELKTKQPILS